ncbi:MAG: transporter substrate-binding domain-containing protein [Usitatibacter sp.]
MKAAALILPLALAFGCAEAPVASTVPAAARAELAPTGKLRVGLIAVNPVFVTPNTPPGVTRGIAVDIARELARRIDVPMEPLRYPTVGAMVEAAGKGEWDIAFLVIDPERASAMNFTAAFMYSENTFLVPGDSTARGIEDLDRPGRTIAVFARSAQEIWLKGNAKNATLVSATSPAAAFQMLKERKVDAVASVASLLADAAKQVPGSRVLPTSFVDSPIGMAVARMRPAAHAYAYEFVEDVKSTGFVREAIAREGLVGVRAAPARDH